MSLPGNVTPSLRGISITYKQKHGAQFHAQQSICETDKQTVLTAVELK